MKIQWLNQYYSSPGGQTKIFSISNFFEISDDRCPLTHCEIAKDSTTVWTDSDTYGIEMVWSDSDLEFQLVINTDESLANVPYSK